MEGFYPNRFAKMDNVDASLNKAALIKSDKVVKHHFLMSLISWNIIFFKFQQVIDDFLKTNKIRRDMDVVELYLGFE